MEIYMLTNQATVNLFDAHAHIPVSLEAQNYCLAGCFPKEWNRISKHAHQAYQIGFGHHPWYTAQKTEYDLLISFLKKYPESFVGEIGLDRSSTHKGTIDIQKEIFTKQLIIAKEYNRPVSIHLVRASALGYDLIHKHYGPQVYLQLNFDTEADLA